MNASVPSAEYLAESRATELNVFYSIPIPLEILTTAWRIYVRVATSPRSGLRWDDHLMSFATVPYTLSTREERVADYVKSGHGRRSLHLWLSIWYVARTSCSIASNSWLTSPYCTGAPFGLGRHIEAVSERDYQTFMKVWLANIAPPATPLALGC